MAWRMTWLALAVMWTAAASQASVGLDQRPSNPSCVAPPRPGTGLGVSSQRVFPFLSLTNDAMAPMVLRQSPQSPAVWYLAERRGVILRIDENAQTATTFLDMSAKVHADLNDGNDEGGLLGMALHPDFAANGEIFVYYTAALQGYACAATLSRFHSTDGGLTIDPSSETVLLAVPKTSTHHHGGALEFGPDGMLYLSIGEDIQGTPAQDTNSRLGKVLRVDVDGGEPYAIPPDNPFTGGGAPEVWAYGFRNPFRFTFDSATGQLWAGDVGDHLFEEVDLVQKGGNYGWPQMEGTSCAPSYPGCNPAGRIPPVFAYDHLDGAPCWAIIGGYVYRGSALPDLIGRYIYSDWCSYDVRALFQDGATPEQHKIGQIAGSFRGFAQDANGELYVLRTRQIEKIVPSPTSSKPFPQHLSETGCVDSANPTQPVPGVIPYTVNVPLWSDGAAKERWMGLPDGKTIDIGPDGDWTLPIGTVLMKNFSLQNKLIETRLFMRHDDGGWAGYSYEWNDAGTDADLLPDSKLKQVGGQTWLYPSRGQCLQCHTEAAGYTLGPTTSQLNGNGYYAATHSWDDQLDTLEHIGVLSSAPDRSQRISTFDGTLDRRARAYFQANCAHCHAPGAPAQASIDFRYTTPIENMKLCGVAPGQGDLGVAGAKLVVPGDPSKSLVSLRMHALGANRMPPVATSVVDPKGTELVDDWIRSLVAEPDGSCITRGPACSDGIDNDGDGLVDYPEDPGCASPQSDTENPKCQDGIDNDRDGHIDFDGGASAHGGPALGLPDPECKSASQDNENPACGLGVEIAVAIPLLRGVRALRRRRPRAA